MKHKGQEMSERRRVFYLIAIMTAVALIAVAIGLFVQ